jgi:hypothetical protein
MRNRATHDALVMLEAQAPTMLNPDPLDLAAVGCRPVTCRGSPHLPSYDQRKATPLGVYCLHCFALPGEPCVAMGEETPIRDWHKPRTVTFERVTGKATRPAASIGGRRGTASRKGWPLWNGDKAGEDGAVHIPECVRPLV